MTKLEVDALVILSPWLLFLPHVCTCPYLQELNCAKATLEERSLTPRTITKYASVLDDPETHSKYTLYLGCS